MKAPQPSIIFITILSALVFIAACKKNNPSPAPPSIIGIWIPSTQTQVTTQNGVIIKDTSIISNGINLGFDTLQFGTPYVWFVSNNGIRIVDTTTYSWNGSVLNLWLFGSPPYSSAVVTATTLTISNYDTLSTSPLTIKATTTVLNR